MNRKFVSIAVLTLAVFLGGCSTISSAYDSTVDTVSGWFKSDSKK
jgi:PBP1b-binding outer membrane lipoprotein LpoB